MENRHYVNNALHNEDQIERTCKHFISHQLALDYVSNSLRDMIMKSIKLSKCPFFNFKLIIQIQLSLSLVTRNAVSLVRVCYSRLI